MREKEYINGEIFEHLFDTGSSLEVSD